MNREERKKAIKEIIDMSPYKIKVLKKLINDNDEYMREEKEFIKKFLELYL